MANTQIFRQEALERLSTPDRLDQGLAVVGTGGWALLWGMIALVLGGLIWSILVVVPVTVQGQGILLGPGGLLDVVSDSQGRVLQLFVREGDKVTSGMKVAHLDQPQLQQDLSAAQGELKDAQRQKQLTLEFEAKRRTATELSITARRRTFDENIEFLKKDIGWIEQQVAIQDALAAKGLTTRDKLLQVRTDLGHAQDELAQNSAGLRQLDDEESKLTVDEAREQLDLELKLATAQRKVETLQGRLATDSDVFSPYGGRVVELKVNPGDVLERGTSLLTLVPDNPAAAQHQDAGVASMVAILYVPSTAGKQVEPGMNVQLAVSTAPREEYGFILGRVRSVAEVPATPEGMMHVLKNRQLVQTLSNNSAPLEVVAELFTDPATPSGYRWSSSRGPNLTIDDGTLATADIEVHSMSLLAIAVPVLRQALGGN